MQRAVFQQATGIKFKSRADQLLPGHDNAEKTPASNDASYQQQQSVLKFSLSVLANVVTGAILLAAMFNLPIILAVIWGL